MKRILVIIASVLVGWNALSLPVPRQIEVVSVEGQILTFKWKAEGPGLGERTGIAINQEGRYVGTILGKRTPDGEVAILSITEGKRYEIQAAGTSVVITLVPELPPAAPEGDFLRAPDDRPQRVKPQSLNSGTYNVDVMVVYTKTARDTAGGVQAIENKAALMVAEANQVYVNSDVNVVLTLVRTAEVNYTEAYGMSSDLSALASQTDGKMDEVHQWRSQYGADVVCLLDVSPENKYAGIAYVLTGVSTWDFAVVDVRYCVGQYVFAHEVGHIFGCLHDRENTSSVAGALPYAYGYRFYVGKNQYRTVMAYAPGWRTPYFSNPDKSFLGVPVGQANSCDNARVHRERASVVADTFPRGVVDLTITVNGGGRVYANGQLIDKSLQVKRGSLISLSAIPNQGKQFLCWSGALAGTNGFVTLTAQDALTITANFNDGAANVPPQITLQPQSSRLAFGDNWALTVDGFGIPSPTVQWRRNGVAIPETTNKTFYILNADATQGGAYSAVLANVAGAVESKLASLYIGDAPQIVEQPQSIYREPGETASFGVRVAVTNGVTYQWLKNNEPMTGKTGDTLYLENVTGSDEGTYGVIISTDHGAVNSLPALLGIILPPQITQQPARTAINLGGSAIFTVAATGREPLTFQWKFNDNPIPAANTASLMLNNVQTAQAGYYSVVVANPYGSVTSTNVALVVNNPLVITSQPTDLTAVKGSTPIFSVVANGSLPITYQWYQNGQAISNQVYSTCRLKNVQPLQSGWYRVEVSNPAGSVFSRDVRLTVLEPPVITVQPQTMAIDEGAYGSLYVGAEGKQPIEYTWYNNGKLLTGTSGSTFSIASMEARWEGLYQAVAQNSDGKATSQLAFVTMKAMPRITQQPQSVTARIGTSFTLSATASGTAPLSWQWWHNGVAQENATNQSLVVAQSTLAEAGTYYVVVTNALGNTISLSATMRIIQPPQILQSPTGLAVVENSLATLTVQAVGESLSYQWLKNGAPINGETKAVLTIPQTQLSDAGNYQVVVRNPDGELTSAQAAIVVNQLPRFLAEPQDVVVPYFTNVTLSCVATGTAPLSFQWKFNDTRLVGATNRTLLLANLQTNQGGFYSVEARNPYGVATSRAAQVTVIQPPVITALASQPANGGAAEGKPLDITVCALGSAPLSYHWRKNGIAIPEANAATWSTGSASGGDAGDYCVDVSNAFGQVRSRTLTVQVVRRPVITQDPQELTVNVGQTATFTANVQIAVVSTFQWLYQNKIVENFVIPGATNLYLVINNCQEVDNGQYRLEVTNPAGSVQSKMAKLTVNNPPVILVQPQGVSTGLGKSVTLTVVARGGDPLNYKWHRVGDTGSLGNEPTFTLSSLSQQDFGSYVVTIHNNDGEVTSMPAVIIFVDAPKITRQPVGQQITLGQALQLEVTAEGVAPLTYRWSRNGKSITSAVGARFAVSQASLDDEGEYAVVVSNGAGEVTSQPAVVKVLSAPVITQQPQNAISGIGGSATFTVTATGRSPLMYQWLCATQALAGATNQTLTLTNLEAAQAAPYQVVIANRDGTNASQKATLTIIRTPEITTQPGNQRVLKGGSAYFACGVQSDAPACYHWQFQGNDIPGATNLMLNLTQVQTNQAGSYRLVVENAAGSSQSLPASLVVLDPPVITLHPQGVTVKAGTTCQLSVSTSGKAPMTYLWKKNSVALTAATNATLVLANVVDGDNGTYQVEVRNSDGLAVSASALVTVRNPPVITTQPQGGSYAIGATATLVVGISGSTPLSCQWYFNNQPILGGTQSILTLAGLQASKEGAYRVTVQNDQGLATSASAAILVQQPPAITRQPQNIQALPGETATLTVTATGKAPLAYQWLRMGTELAGATNSTLILANLSSVDFTGYQVNITNRDGRALSGTATVETAAMLPVAIVTQPLSTRIARGASGALSVVASGTAPFGYQWYFNGQLISRANSPTFPITMADSLVGGYFVTITNFLGTVTSRIAQVAMAYLPEITTEPEDLVLPQGQNGQLTVVAIGAVDYQWLKEGLPLYQARASVLSFVNAQTNQNGKYKVLASNQDGHVSSREVTVRVQLAPVITRQPVNQTTAKSGAAYFAVVATGENPLQYQWFKDNLALAGALGPGLQLTNVQLTDAGSYRVQVKNAAGEALSTNVALAVKNPPIITQQPMGTNIIQSRSLTLLVVADGATPFTYQWYKDGITLPGSTNNHLPLLNVQSNTTGNYLVRVKNSDGEALSQTAMVKVLLAPWLIYQPARQRVAQGGTVNFSVAAGGEAPLTYYWLFNGLPVTSGVNLSLLTINNAQTAQRGEYSVMVSNLAGSVTSMPVGLDFKQPPVLLRDLEDQIVAEGSNAVMQVEAGGLAPFTYAWYKDGLPILASSPALVISNVSQINAGHYAVQVANADGSTVSRNASLQIGRAPLFVKQPQSQKVNLNSNVTLFMTVESPVAPDFYWLKNDLLVLGPTAATNYTFEATPEAIGTYSVIASNAWGATTSDEARIVLKDPPLITGQPQGMQVNEGDTVKLVVKATGLAPITYRWYKNDLLINGPNQAYLFIENIQPEEAGRYSVALSNPDGSTTSQVAEVTVKPRPVIVEHPHTQVVTVSNTVTLRVIAQSGEVIQYQWYLDMQAIPDATSNELKIEPVQLNQSGEYLVLVSNSAGAVWSEPASVIVLPVQPMRIPKAQNQAVIVQIGRTKAGQVGLLFFGEPGRTYNIEASANFVDWTKIGKSTIQYNPGQFADTKAQARATRYYRLVLDGNTPAQPPIGD